MVRIMDRFLRIEDVYGTDIVSEYEVVDYTTDGKFFQLKRFNPGGSCMSWETKKSLKKWNIKWLVHDSVPM